MTRKQKADELLERLESGPSWSKPDRIGDDWNSYPQQYKRWSNTWIIPVVMQLVPELRKLKRK